MANNISRISFLLIFLISFSPLMAQSTGGQGQKGTGQESTRTAPVQEDVRQQAEKAASVIISEEKGPALLDQMEADVLADAEPVDADTLPVADEMDSLFYYTDSYTGTSYQFLPKDVPWYPDSVLEARLQELQKEIPLSYNAHVRSFIKVYAINRRSTVERMLGLEPYYFPYVESVFAEQGVPLELKYLAIVESALNPIAVSRAGATGLWQFMYATGRLYGLKVDRYRDERRNPYKSTYAAAQYLKEMYQRFGDWHLAIASYNCGPGNINRAIRRAGGARDFWEIMPYLPRETRSYVPAWIAATYIMNHADAHNLRPQAPVLAPTGDSVMVNRPMTFDQLSTWTGLEFDHIKLLNPELRWYAVPDEVRSDPWPVYLTPDKTAWFRENRDSLYALIDSTLAQNPQFVQEYRPQGLSNAPERIVYKVKSGDNLGYIAGWFNVSVTQLREWNGLHGNKIYPGQSLSIYVPESRAHRYQSINQMSFAQKQGLGSGGPAPAVQNRTASASTGKANPTHSDRDWVYHTVQAGDTLWDIAQRYQGATVESIKKDNNIYNSRGLQPGMVLKVVKKG